MHLTCSAFSRRSAGVLYLSLHLPSHSSKSLTWNIWRRFSGLAEPAAMNQYSTSVVCLSYDDRFIDSTRLRNCYTIGITRPSLRALSTVPFPAMLQAVPYYHVHPVS